MTASECSWAPRAATRRKRRAVAIGSAAEGAAARRRAAAKGIRLKRERRPKSAAVTNLLNWLGERVPHPKTPPQLVINVELNSGSLNQNRNSSV